MKVLIVEDSEMTRVIIRKTLKSLGVENVYDAVDGRDAVEVYDRETPDVIFSDWNMPNMDGLEMLKEIRQRSASVPVIMITTERSRGRVMEAIHEGITDYMVKPFSPASLKEKLMKWVTVPQSL